VSTDVTLAGARLRAPASARAASRRQDGRGLAVGAAAAAIALLPLLRPAGPVNAAPVDVLIALAFLATLLWLGSSRHQLRLPYAIPLGLILVGGALGALSGPVPRAGGVALVQDVTLLLWFWAVVNIGSSPQCLQILLRVWAYAAIGWAAVLLGSVAAGVNAISGQVEAEGVRTALTFGNPNVAGNYFFISIMIVWATDRPRRPAVRLTAYALLLAALGSTGSNSALVALGAGATIALLLAVYRRAGLVPAVTAVAGVVLAAGVVFSTFSMRDMQSSASRSSYAFIRDGIGRSEEAASDRGLLLREGIDLYKSGGPLGAGPTSTKVRLDEKTAHRAAEAHSDYLAAINERGVLGLVGVLLLVAGITVEVLRLAQAPTRGGVVRGIVRPHALAGAIAGMLVAMTTTEYLHVRHTWTLFALVVAGAAMARK
jgi:O-antigen ligase